MFRFWFFFISLISMQAFAAPNSEGIKQVNDYLNSLTTLEGKFVQIAADSTISEGKFYLRRPGRIRFEYNDPITTKVIADGFWVAVSDTRLKTLDRYPLSETPLNLILKENVNLGSEANIASVETSGDHIRVTARDAANPDQGEIVLIFDTAPIALRQWVITDVQGLQTTIALQNTRTNIKIEPSLFVIEELNKAKE